MLKGYSEVDAFASMLASITGIGAWTNQEFIDRLGVSRETAQTYYSGRKIPNASSIEKLCTYLALRTPADCPGALDFAIAWIKANAEIQESERALRSAGSR